MIRRPFDNWTLFGRHLQLKLDQKSVIQVHSRTHKTLLFLAKFSEDLKPYDLIH